MEAGLHFQLPPTMGLRAMAVYFDEQEWLSALVKLGGAKTDYLKIA
jgi:hypothetical protein